MKYFLFFLKLFSALTVENYQLSVIIQDRYVRSDVAVHVINDESEDQEYDFAVKLQDDEFISSLVMRVGDKREYLSASENLYAYFF